MAYQMDFFAGIESKVLAAIEATKVKYPAYVFVRDEAESTTGRLAFVDQNNVLKYIRGENKQQVVYVDVLPEVEQGDVETLYICGGIVYVFDGTEFKPQYKDCSAELEELKEKVSAIETKVVELEETDGSLADQIAALEEKINAIEIPEECKCVPNNKYDITDIPAGTLVDYFDKEIRIMCPSNAEFVKQSVGEGGDANTYYMTFKVYAPNDAATGYIEHLNGESDSEILNKFSVDANGRRYQPTWLGLAKYDEASDSWSYYGASSTKEKFIGWNYQIDWYDDNGVMIASDSVRINLSNEDCHSMLEPFYITSVKTELSALQDAVDKLGENTGSTFTELE